MKKILSLLAVLMFLAPSLTFAETTSVATVESLRAEIARLNAMLDGGAQTPVTVTYSCLDLPNLTRGMKNENVTKLQNLLKSIPKAKWQANVSATGYFGVATQEALINFQLANQIILTKTSLGAGKFGPKTRAFVKNLTCSTPAVITPVDTTATITTPVTTTEPVVTPVTTAPVVMDPGLYVSIVPQAVSNPVFESGDLAPILTLRFKAVGMDLNLKRIGLDFTKGDVVGVERLDIVNASQAIVGSVNTNSKTFYVDLTKDVLIKSESYADLTFMIKVGAQNSLVNDFYQLNIDTENLNNTYAVNTASDAKVNISSPQKFDNQGAWLLDSKDEASISVISPIAITTYAPGETIKIGWYASTFMPTEKVKIEILDKSGVLGAPILPSIEVENTGSYDFVLPQTFNAPSGNFVVKLSCTIHECESTSITLSTKTN